MTRQTKREKAVAGKVDSNKLYPIDAALALVKECAKAKFDESIDVAVQLGIDAKKSDQVVRGAVVLPNGTGKSKRVAVFAQGAKAEEAKAAGADVVGMDDLAAQVKAGNLNFDVVIASPDTMRVVLVGDASVIGKPIDGLNLGKVDVRKPPAKPEADAKGAKDKGEGAKNKGEGAKPPAPANLDKKEHPKPKKKGEGAPKK